MAHTRSQGPVRHGSCAAWFTAGAWCCCRRMRRHDSKEQCVSTTITAAVLREIGEPLHLEEIKIDDPLAHEVLVRVERGPVP